MRTMKRLSFSIILGLLLCIAPSVQAQVTMGSAIEPNAGSLLDLKENNNAANATKGLGMPRVKLTDKSNLYPMFETTAGSGVANGQYASALKAGVDAQHIGLMVYNVEQCTLQGKGLYVWDGAQWQVLGEDIVSLEGMAKKLGTAQDAIAANGAAWHKDQSGNIFLSGDFGATAGRWMITNLAATNYATGGTAPTNSYNPSNSYTAAYWGYPNRPNTATAGLSTTYDARKRLGLLYTYTAATGGQNENPVPIEQGNTQHSGVQGICPIGRQVPTDWEWTQLENEIVANTASYSSTPNIETGALPNVLGWRGTFHGDAMKDICESTVGSGTSHSPLSGGFGVLLAGYADSGFNNGLGDEMYFWSNSSSDQQISWSRGLEADYGSVNRERNLSHYFMSVRCKKD